MKNLIWYAICQLYKRKYMSVLTMSMLLFSFIILEYSGINYVSFRYSEWKTRSVVQYEYEDIYNINLFKYAFAGGEDIGKLIEFYDSLEYVEGLEGYGIYSVNIGESVNVLYLSGSLAGMCGISLYKGDIAGTAFVGKNISSEFPDGSEYYDEMTGVSFTVSGTIDRGSRFISDDYFGGDGYFLELDDYIVVDYDALLAEDESFILNGINNFYIIVPEGADKNNILREIRGLSEKAGIDIYGINSMEYLFEQLSEKAVSDAEERYLMPLVLLVCACMAMMVATMISVRINRRDAGIMLANGMTRRDITVIYIVENVVKVLPAFLISILFWYKRADDYLEHAREIFGYLIPLYLLTAIIVAGISSMTSVIYFRRKMPCELIGEEV